MFANLVSWSRFSGVSKNGKEYDSIVLHCSIPRETVETKTFRVFGYPVQFRDVSIPVSKWFQITGLSESSCGDIYDFLTDHINESVELVYNITTYNGVDRAFIAKVTF